MTISEHSDLVDNYPILNTIEHKALDHLLSHSKLSSYAAGNKVFSEEDQCNYFFFILSGVINIQKINENGHVITLYTVKEGQACELTTTCLLGEKHHYPAESIATTAVEMLKIPRDDFLKTMEQSKEFQHFVYSVIDDGVSHLVSLLEEVAFSPMDLRIAQHLLNNANSANMIYMTHMDLSIELGTAREVVSRVLEKFEKKNWVKLSRGHIEIKERNTLWALSKNQN